MLKIKLIFILALSSCLLTGCLKDVISSKEERKELRNIKRCNKKLDRLTAKCPQLLSKEVVEIPVPVKIDSLGVSKEFETNKDVSGVDSIIDIYTCMIDSLLRSTGDPTPAISDLATGIKNYILQRDCIEDSIIIDTVLTILVNGTPFQVKLTFGAYPVNGNIGLFADIPQQKFSTTATVEYEQVSAKKLTFKQRLIELYRQFTGLFWILLFIGIISAITFFLLKRKGII